ncbi:hypothetical protein AUK41_00015 [Candidatus Berkelbacteria bacterium CG2_30_43_20]|nr:MAG: hypothetical protein AUK41_00015 [Candidatus Berkelbacteria bacterium CG2_30_43_20]
MFIYERGNKNNKHFCCSIEGPGLSDIRWKTDGYTNLILTNYHCYAYGHDRYLFVGCVDRYCFAQMSREATAEATVTGAKPKMAEYY